MLWINLKIASTCSQKFVFPTQANVYVLLASDWSILTCGTFLPGVGWTSAAGCINTASKINHVCTFWLYISAERGGISKVTSILKIQIFWLFVLLGCHETSEILLFFEFLSFYVRGDVVIRKISVFVLFRPFSSLQNAKWTFPMGYMYFKSKYMTSPQVIYFLRAFADWS
jgi:hypothetical protein